jgi:hypothetical protein
VNFQSRLIKFLFEQRTENGGEYELHLSVSVYGNARGSLPAKITPTFDGREIGKLPYPADGPEPLILEVPITEEICFPTPNDKRLTLL